MMFKSESIVNLTKALFNLQCMIGTITKDSVNPYLKNKYASLTAILDGINEPLKESGIIIMQNPGNDGNYITLTTILIHAETGEHMESTYSMLPSKQDPQAIGSCITYMRRYALSSILKLNVEDDDGNAASHKNKSSNINEDLGINIENNKKQINYSEKFIRMLDKINSSKTIDDLNDIGYIIKQEITNQDEKDDLKSFYKKRLDFLSKDQQS